VAIYAGAFPVDTGVFLYDTKMISYTVRGNFAQIGPKHGVQIGLETFLRNGMGKVSDVLLRLPFLPVLVHIGPMETSGIVLGIPEIIDLIASLSEGGHHFWLVWVPPSGGDIYFGHG